ncbi:MAG: hypothetical protein KDD99_06115 [Bacteroidetes bacterium]|nr:hypothetical protein [Bacteroidota bacterium]
MSNSFSYIWTTVSNIGVSRQYPFVENVKIKLLNQINFLGWLFELVLLLIAPLSPHPLEYSLVVVIFIIIQGIVIGLHHFQKIKAARYFSSFITPAGTAVMMLYTREHFGEGYLFVMSIFMAFILFSDQIRIRNLIIAANILLYMAAAAYVVFHPREIPGVSTGIDEHVVFLMCIIGMGIVIMLYQNELRKNQERHNELINKLREKNDELSESNAELERFTYIASHDLKAPIRTIINFLEVMEKNIERQSYDNLLKTLKHVKTGAQQMYYVVTDILEYSSINQNVLEKHPLSLNEIVDKVKANLQVEIDEKQAIVSHTSLPSIIANDIEVITLFQNLIENGIKYNVSKPPQVSVSSEYMEDYFLLKFKDNGIGIDPKYHTRIFELFQRLHTLSDYQGTGLGLGICSKIVKSYGGEIWVESAPEKGSVFIVQLPIDLITLNQDKPSQRELTEKIMME